MTPASKIAALVLAAWLATVPQRAIAQSTHGAITGTVTDASGAVIPGAKVEALNQGTGIARSMVTDAQGDYLFLNLDPSTYSITVSSQNFTTEKNTDIVLPARETVRADIQLELSVGVEQVMVIGGQEVTTEVPTRFTSHTGDEINSLALNFRATPNPSPIVVANLAPGVQSDGSGNITFSGQLPTATSFSLDGISTQLPRYGGPTKDLFPSVEGIAEFRVNTAANSAEYSQVTDLTVISRSGTNDFHGGGYWYFQRKDFDSKDQISGIIPNGDADDFGASLGGPLPIPGLYKGKDRTFFYFDYEGIRLNSNTLISTFTPPTQWRSGDFSGSGATAIIDPLNGQPFPGNMIPANRINSVSAKALPLFFPTPTSSGALLSSPNLVQSFPGSYNLDNFDGRIDHSFTPNHRVWFRVTQKNIPSIGTDAALGAGGAGDTTYNPLMGSFTTSSDLWNFGGSYSWLIRPNLINEFRAGYSRANFNFSYPQAKQGDADITSLGITGLPGSPKNGLGGVPVFYIGDFLGGQTNPFGHPRVNKNGVLEFGDSLSWVMGSHNLKFGGEFRRLNYQDNITFLLGDEYGDYFFTGNYTLPTGAKNSDVYGFADYLLGFVADAQQAQNGPDGKPFGYHYGGYAQDKWRLRPNFTINYGIRYEVNTPFDDETNQLGNFDRRFPGGRLVVQGQKGLSLINPLWKQAVGNTPFVTNDQAGLPHTLRYTYWENIQPRLGFAWKPFNDEGTVIRASAGIYSVPVLGAVLYSLLGVDTSYFADYPSTATNPRTFPNVFSGSNAVAPHPSYRRANQYDLKDPRVIQWNFSIEHDIGFRTLARASYTGSHTYNLIYSPDLNQMAPNTLGYSALTATPALRQQNLRYPNFAEVLTRDNGPSDKYEALTLELNRRFSSNLTFQTNYTWAHNDTNALGVAPTSAIPTGGQGDNGQNVSNYYDIRSDTGNAFYTRRHRFVNTFVYNLPFGRNKRFMGKVSRAGDLFVGGWSVTGVTLLQTGPWQTPYFPTSLSDPSGTNPSQRSVKQQRPDCVAGQTGYLSNPTTAVYYNVNAFTVPGNDIGRFGNCGVGILQGPGTATFSMSAGKTFPITERFRLRYEAQFANLFNVVNRDVPNVNVSGSSFGLISQSQLVEQAGPRTIQMMLRLQF
ncbi:MAG TPA: TonB-dependent receptor [Bryobacteraceae bacterium]|nr:TonB-dependent receptor [Bryobacteraceae bacterium]